ncbi:hypothetical protein BGZ46_003694 [Entomortierella lignicola]|nr:hypothetical protein BGZ46_003694 [Entomortierella lignicola]
MPPPPQLHVCDEENGYALNDLENFSQTHKMCLLSLLRVLQSSLLSISEEEYAEMKNINGMETHHHDHDAQTSSLLLLQRRIDIAIRYMLQFFSIPDLEYILQSPSDMDMEEFNNETLPNLQIQDFADSAISRIQQTSTVDGRILGPLTQRNTRASSRSRNNSIPSSNPRMRGMGFVQWLCPYHSQIHCQAETRETLKAVIGKNGGSCVEQERFAELHFKTRENAAEFYNLMVEYRCIAKLQIKIGWKNLTEEDLWNLAEVVNESDIGGLILDCNYDPESEEQEAEYMGQPRPRLSFKPLLGMLFSPNLASFALENFPGSLPVLEESNFTCSPESFTLQDFRRSNPSECKLPPFSNLRTLVLNRCGPEPKANRLMPLIRHCPLLTEIQLECDDLDTSIAAIRGIATNLTFLRLSESMWEGIDMRFTKAGESGTHSSTQSKSIIRSIGRKTKRSLDLPYDGVVEQFATCAFMNLWEQHQTTLVNIVTQNPGLHDIELMCEARSMDRLWRFLTSHYLRHQQTYIQQQQFEQMSLHQNQPVDTSESFLRLRLYDGTVSLFTITPLSNLIVMHGYTSQHRQLLQSLEDITTALCIGSTFDSPEQLALLQSEAEQEGGIRFDNLLWILSLNQQDDPGFLHQLRALLSTTSNFKTFTMRIYVMLFDIGNLIYLWNWVCGAAYLNEEHGRWIQACFEHSSQASYDQFNAATNEESKNDVLKHKYPNDDFHDDSHENNSMELSETVSHTPLHGIMRSYNLQLDEEHDLVLSSSHFYFSPMMNTSVTGARTALSYALTLTQK